MNQVITSFSDGSFLVVWRSFGQSMSGLYELVGQRFGLNGNTIGLETSLGIYSETEIFHDIVTLESGDFLLAWNMNDTIHQDDIYAKIYCGVSRFPTGEICASIFYFAKIL